MVDPRIIRKAARDQRADRRNEVQDMHTAVAAMVRAFKDSGKQGI